MEFFTKVMEFFQGNTMVIIVTTLLCVSEGLSGIESVKANGVFQAISNGLKWIKDTLIK